jgi:abortive infection bacteriophage resistance protein
MKYRKPPVSFDDQVAKLKARGLDFKDEARAKIMLSRISFYRLRAYTYPFQDNADPNHPFIQKVDFETILKLYKFDRKLRLLVFGALEKIEIALRTQIIYQMAMKHGSHWHIDQNNYHDKSRAIKQLSELQKEVDRSDETFIKHYKHKYTSPDDPPSWMGLEVASFGTLSKLYRNIINSPEKKAIVNNFGLKNVYILENWMFCFSILRNICAHHGRLWNRRLTAIPKLPYNTSHPFIEKVIIDKLHHNKLYASLCCIKYMLSRIESNFNFSKKLIKLMDKCPLEQEKAMGFPDNWRAHHLWKN